MDVTQRDVQQLMENVESDDDDDDFNITRDDDLDESLHPH